MGRAGQIATAAAAFSLTGCLATQGDIRVLQNDLVVMRQEQQQSDKDRKAQGERLAALIQTLSESNIVARDSINAVIARMRSYHGDDRQDLRDINDKLLRLVEVFDQNQRKLQDIRATVEQSRKSPPPPTSGGVATDTSASGPGPNQLFQMGRNYILSARYPAAKEAYESLLEKYPNADVAPDAQLGVGEALAGDKQPQAADSVYALVVQKYPKSDAAPTALFRRGTFAQNQGRPDEALAFYKEVVEKYPRSDAAASAKQKITELSKH